MDQSDCIESLSDCTEDTLIDISIPHIALQENIVGNFLAEFLDSTVTAEV